MFHRVATTDIQFSYWENEFNLPSTRSRCRVKNGMNECCRFRLLNRKKLNVHGDAGLHVLVKKKKREKFPCIYRNISSNSDFFLNLKFFFKVISTIVYRELVGRNIKFFIQDLKKNVIIS